MQRRRSADELASNVELLEEQNIAMPVKIDIAELASLNQIINRVEQGEEILLTRQGEAIARLSPILKSSQPLQSRAALRQAQDPSSQTTLESLQMLHQEARY